MYKIAKYNKTTTKGVTMEVTKTKIRTATLLDLIALLLISLKLAEAIEVSWLWVLAPWWIPLSFTLGFLIGDKFLGGAQ
tara:strand:- start:2244 stop:2480 length:237 start_codon:yes stop_codon:yes gene_type:complete